ncbi:Oxidoreductase, molybdopterin-binding domain-containing protein [Scleroderma yunnanense]
MGVTDLRVLSKVPYNAEPSLAELVKKPITPVHLVYKRNHSDIIDLKSTVDSYTVKIDGNFEGLNERTITYSDILHHFPRREVVAVLVCAGNRRATMAATTGREVKGIKWGDGAACNVRWAGARLRDILLSAGIADGGPYEGYHVCFASRIAPCEDDEYYGGSIPLADAMSEDGDALLSYEMNGELLEPGHGYPLRVVVPGTYGMRWVKWVDQITISKEESPNFYQQRDYKVLPDTVTTKAMAESEGWWNKVPSMQLLACNSAVADGRRLFSACPEETRIKVTGYAYSYCPIFRVELSVDNGTTWEDAKITYQEGQRSWALWQAELELILDDEAEMNGVIVVEEGNNGRVKRKMTVLSRAVDSSGNEQELDCKWNLRGVGYSGAGERTIEV